MNLQLMFEPVLQISSSCSFFIEKSAKNIMFFFSFSPNSVNAISKSMTNKKRLLKAEIVLKTNLCIAFYLPWKETVYYESENRRTNNAGLLLGFYPVYPHFNWITSLVAGTLEIAFLVHARLLEKNK